ncbi:reverse transcriptase domain-containing protein [Suicoccus acidiformans]|uniref:reverse transcriptase domain-containing protein n=1 Tax=Suicoccus acidiformans TaxID=2036206 RepID=UPI0013C32DE7|nr:reverse transcriptase domain-containing protein [Suicoccus acidiformans]
MIVDDIEETISEYGSAILRKVKGGNYQVLPVNRVYIPKDSRGKCVLGIPVVRDRIVQQMILNILDPYIAPHFSDHSYGFRKGRNAHDAIHQVEAYTNEGVCICREL